MSTSFAWFVPLEYSVDRITSTASNSQQQTVVLDGQRTMISGTIALSLQSSASMGRKYLTVDMSSLRVSASQDARMACNDNEKGRYWYTEQVEILMYFSGSGSDSLLVMGTAPSGTASAASSAGAAAGTFDGDPTASLSTGYSAQSYAAAVPVFRVTDQSSATQVHHVYQLVSTPDVSYKDPWSLKHVHSGLNSGVVTLWAVSDTDGVVVFNLPTPSQAVWRTASGTFDNQVTLTVKVVHHLAKITVSKKKSGLSTKYTTNVTQSAYTFLDNLAVDFSKVSDVTG